MKLQKNLTYVMLARFISLLCIFWLPIMHASAADTVGAMNLDAGIEGIRSQQFSVAIFYFLITAIIVFLVIVFMFMLKTKASKLKTGEKWLFAWLLLGVAAAIGFGSAQMLHGYLF